jgi:hypothetical protein
MVEEATVLPQKANIHLPATVRRRHGGLKVRWSATSVSLFGMDDQQPPMLGHKLTAIGWGKVLITDLRLNT